MKTFMFPGQGSQSKGMGGALFDEYAALTEQADEILGYSIRELCLEDPWQKLNDTQYTQSALYVVNALTYYRKIETSGQNPDFLAGHSLGELNALLAAECFDFATGLRLVQKRGQLMAQVANGAMAAILHATRDEIEATLQENGLYNIDLANYNTPSQIVISGAKEEVAQAQALFRKGIVRCYPLNTSGAFHSRFMLPVKEEFHDYVMACKLAELKIPVIANVTARPYRNDDVAQNLSNQLAGTVRWSESIQYLMGLSADSSETMEFEEVGHGDVLTKLHHTIKQQASQPAVEPDNGAMKAAGSNLRARYASGAFVPATEKVSTWNRAHPVGTAVKSLIRDYGVLETRTEAVTLFGRRAAVYMKGYNGYFDLDEIVPV